MKLLSFLVLSIALVISLPEPVYAAQESVNIYSARKEALIKPLLDEFSQDTGIEINLVTAEGDALLTRLKSEGEHSPADLLLTVDVGRLHRAKQAGVLQALPKAEFAAQVPEKYRDAEGAWFGLSLRSRVFVYSPERVQVEELSSYESLSTAAWKGRVCIRSSGNIYNQSWIASMIAHHGQKKADAWLKDFTGSFARPPRGGDRDQIKAVAAGQCDLAVVNSYYLGAMLNSQDKAEKAAAQKVKLFWPNQNGRGAHMNVSGVGLTKSAPNKKAALKLMAFLLSDKAQAWYGKTNHEYPVREGIDISATLNAWGAFKADDLAVAKLGSLNGEAVKAMDRAGWQ